MEILMNNKNGWECLAEVEGTGKILSCKKLPEWVTYFVDEVTDQSIIDWFKNRKDSLNPEFILQKVVEEGRAYLEIKINETSIRVRGTRIEVKGKVNMSKVTSFSRCLKLAQDFATILYYDQEATKEAE